MTCEVAVMNARGLALAADSAATLGDGLKIYLSAKKLFGLASHLPVGIMTYGRADLAGMPWETIVAGYRRHLGNCCHDTLADYLSDFVAFIEGSTMFPDARQQEYFADIARGLWLNLYLRPWKKELDKKSRDGSDDPYELLRRLIAEDHSSWEECPLLERVDPHFPDAVIAEYEDVLKETEREVFESDELPEDIRGSLRKSLRLFLSRRSSYVPGCSGLVIAGMGEAEHFPRLLHCCAGPIVKGRLRLVQFEPHQITQSGQAAISPFAQSGIIETIIRAIHPDLLDDLPRFVFDSLDETSRKGAEGILKRFRDRLEQETLEKYTNPFVKAVAAMPAEELATIAEVLVNLTAFRAHASIGQQETVAGPIDVALLSKDEGFVWVKGKRSGTPCDGQPPVRLRSR